MRSSIVLIGIILFGITGCSVIDKARKDHRDRICSQCPVKTETKDSTWEHLVHDTVILPPIQGPVILVDNPCSKFCDSLGNLKPYYRQEHHNGITSTISTRPGSLVFECAADSLRAVIDKMERESYHRKETTVERLVYCNKAHQTKWGNFLSISGLILWIILLIYGLWRVFKDVLKAYVPWLRVIK